jgi:hypothetical protein
MAVGVLFELPGVTQEQYETITDKLTGGSGLSSLSDWPVEGVLAHIAGPSQNGWRVVDVWESEEAFQRFGEHLIPITQELGLQPQPQLFPLHNFVKD